MPEDELARRLTDVERRVAILEGAVPRCGAFTPEENLAAAWDQMAKLKDNLMTLALEGRPRPAKRLEYVQLYTLRRPPGFSYGSGTMNSPDDYEKLLGADENKIASLASCLANATRVRIVMALFDGEKTSSELTAATGLSGGPLYHHLRELAKGGFLVSDDRRVYKLSSLGLDLTVTFLVDVTHDRWTSPRKKALTDISDASEGDNAR